MSATITAGATAFGSWTTPWAVAQRGSGLPGYNATPPGAWVTPQRAAMGAGDLIGVRASCFSGSGTLSVQFSIDNGTILTVTEQTKETDKWGTTVGYWFVLPSGMSAGKHEIRARLVPSVSGTDRILQGQLGNGFAHDSSLVIIIGAEDFYAVVGVGGSASGTAGVARVSTPYGSYGAGNVEAISPTPYSSIFAASAALTAAMALGGNKNHGAIIYVRSGTWQGRPSETTNNEYWLTIKGHPSDARNTIIIGLATNDANNVNSRWVKFERVTFQLRAQYDGSLLHVSSNSFAFWSDDFALLGIGQTVSNGAFIVNKPGGFQVITTRGTMSDIRGSSSRGDASWMRHMTWTNCNSDMLTTTQFCVGFNAVNQRALNNIPGGDQNLDEHGDFWQTYGSENKIFCDIDANAGFETGDGYMAIVQSGPGVATSNSLFENWRLTGFSESVAGLAFGGENPVGVLMRNISCNGIFAQNYYDSAATFDSCELVNCVYLSWNAPNIAAATFISRLKANGKYEGNHNISGTNADSTDTTGTPAMDASGIPTSGGNLSGRSRVTLADAGGYRRANPTYAGAYSALTDRVTSPIASPIAPIVSMGRTFSMTVPSGLTARYTTTGVNPTISTGTAYSGAVSLTANITFTIRNFEGSEPSVTTTAAYQVITNGTPAPPRIFP